jgi:hypothetical protein
MIPVKKIGMRQIVLGGEPHFLAGAGSGSGASDAFKEQRFALMEP